jgi:hypothetical protein
MFKYKKRIRLADLTPDFYGIEMLILEIRQLGVDST